MANVAKMFKSGVVIILIVVAIIGALCFNSAAEYVDNDEYVIHQSAFTGKLTVWNTPGWHGQWFGKVVHFKKAQDIYLSSEELDGGSGKSVQPVSVVFPDGKAEVDVVARYELSLADSIQKEIYKKYGNPEAVHSMIRQQIIEAVQGVGPLMSSSSAYSSRKPEVALLARSMSLDGIYASQVLIDTTFDNSTAVFVKRYNVKRVNGKPVITKPSILGVYGIILPVFSVKNMDFDSKTVKLIEARKDAQLASQSAITAYQNGQALIAEEKATQEVLKIKEVTIAQKSAEVATIKAQQDKDVAVLNATKLREVATENLQTKTLDGDAMKVTARAKEVAIKKSGALTETEKYTIDAGVKRDIGVAEANAKRPVPGIIVGGSGSSGEGSGNGIETAVMVGLLKELNLTTK